MKRGARCKKTVPVEKEGPARIYDPKAAASATGPMFPNVAQYSLTAGMPAQARIL